MKKIHRVIFFLIGVGGMVLLITHLDPSEKNFKEVLHPNTLLFLAGMLLLWALIYALHTQAYFTIIGPDKGGLRWRSLYRIIVCGFALNNMTPFGLAGGEPYRIMEIRPYIGMKRAVSSTLSFTMLFIIGHVLMWITGIVVYVFYGCPGETWVTVLLLITAAVFTAAVLLFFLKKKGGFVVPVVKAVGKLPFMKKPVQRFLDKNIDHLREIDESYIEFKNHERYFKLAALTEYGARILECVEYYLIFLYIGEHVNIFSGILILGMASLIGNLFFMIPMQAGTREGGMIMALRWLGIDPAMGVPGGLLYRVRDILLNMIGIALILIGKKHEAKVQKDEVSDADLAAQEEDDEPKAAEG